MTNQDEFNIARDAGEYKKAAELAIDFGRGKASKSGAWAWADDAVRMAAKAGITLNPGRMSFPDFDKMTQALNAS